MGDERQHWRQGGFDMERGDRRRKLLKKRLANRLDIVVFGAGSDTSSGEGTHGHDQAQEFIVVSEASFQCKAMLWKSRQTRGEANVS